jgi:hypothetical protein
MMTASRLKAKWKKGKSVQQINCVLYGLIINFASPVTKGTIKYYISFYVMLQ